MRISPLMLGSTAELAIQSHQKAESDWPLSKCFPYESSVNVDYAKENSLASLFLPLLFFFQTIYKLLIIISYNYLDTNAFVLVNCECENILRDDHTFSSPKHDGRKCSSLYTYSILCY